MRVLVLCVALAMLALGVLGCQQAQENATTEGETMMEEGKTMVEEGTAMMEEGAEGMKAEMPLIDPVCGMTVTMESEWTAEHEGVTYYFCSEACRDNFVAEPLKFIKVMTEEVIPT